MALILSDQLSLMRLMAKKLPLLFTTTPAGKRDFIAMPQKVYLDNIL